MSVAQHPAATQKHDAGLEIQKNLSFDARDVQSIDSRLDFSMAEEVPPRRAPIWQCMVAGGIGGLTGDVLMHSLDTVKTRQQGDLHSPPKYTTMSSSYYKIFREEGIRRGLYGGVTPALLGSLPATVIFFGVYESSKRRMLDYGLNEHVTFLTAGFFADLVSSVVYVPSEVLKTRLQLQGRYNNPFFKSGYNYRSTADAVRTIVRQEGFAALFHGYKATILRDLPFSALQFAFYEQMQKWSRQAKGTEDIGLPLEILTGSAAGGLAGMITCPLDVVKTRIQTQIQPISPLKNLHVDHTPSNPASASNISHRSSVAFSVTGQKRLICTTSPSTASPKPDAPTINTSSIAKGLKFIYKTEGVAGWFRGVGPRLVWTSIQSGTMLVLYQTLLRQIGRSVDGDDHIDFS